MEKAPPVSDLQVGGHGGKHSMVFRGGECLKPATSKREVAWYRSLAEGTLPRVLVEERLCPAFFGMADVGGVQYLRLENALSGFEHPSVADVKLGTRTWDRDCDSRKKATHLRADSETSTRTLGFRFCGATCWDLAIGGRRPGMGKGFGQDCADPAEALGRWLWDGQRDRARDVVPALLPKLRRIRDFLALRTHVLFASSLLLAYDSFRQGEPTRADVRLIDFAHTWKADEVCEEDRESGALLGVDVFISCLAKIAPGQ